MVLSLGTRFLWSVVVVIGLSLGYQDYTNILIAQAYSVMQSFA